MYKNYEGATALHRVSEQISKNLKWFLNYLSFALTYVFFNHSSLLKKMSLRYCVNKKNTYRLLFDFKKSTPKITP